MTELSFLTAIVLGWALGCGSLYALLRYFSVHFAPAVRTAGAWSLAMWVLVYMSLGSRSLRLSSGEAQPSSLEMAVLAALSGGFGAGTLLLRFLPHRNELWWHDVLFCALYFGCAHTWGYALLVCWPMTQGPLYEISRWHGGLGEAHLLMLCVWLFPLGAPLMELLGRNLWRMQREMASLKRD